MAGKVDDLNATCGAVGLKDVVYAVTATVSGTMTAAFTSADDGAVSLRSECGKLLPDEGAEITCASGNNTTSQTSMWVHKGQTVYVIAETAGAPYSLILSITRCGNNVKEGLEQCDDSNNASCVGCVLCNDSANGEFQDPATKHCYRLFTSSTDWASARASCVAWGGDLVGISSKTEYDFIEQHSNPQLSNSTWFGGYAVSPLCSYAWVNGEPWHSEWGTDRPNSAGSSCIELSTNVNRRMIDLGCGNIRDYLCERAPAGTCGDGIVQPGEQCDGPGTAPGGTCDASCKITFTCNGSGEFEDAASKHCYKIFTQAAMWSSAQAACAAWGGYLAVVDSDGENALIKNHMGADTWIGGWEGGLNDGTTVWESPVVDCSYKNWKSGEPNDANKDCVSIHNNDSLWYDDDCTGSKDYACEKAP